MTNRFYQESLRSCSTTCVHWSSRQRFEPRRKLSWRGPTGYRRVPLANTKKLEKSLLNPNVDSYSKSETQNHLKIFW